MPIILKSLSLYASLPPSSPPSPMFCVQQPPWFTAGDIICLCVAFSVFNRAVNMHPHGHISIQPPTHTPASNTCTTNFEHPDYSKRDHQVCSPRSLVNLYTTLVSEYTFIFYNRIYRVKLHGLQQISAHNFMYKHIIILRF